jgi:hypothetical protein
MSKPNVRYVVKAVPGTGWRIWNRQTKRWWGNFFKEHPQKVLDELNGEKRPDALSNLAKLSYARKKDRRQV